MRTLYTALLIGTCGLVASSFGRNGSNDESQWLPSNESPALIAKTVDSAMGALRHIQAYYVVKLDYDGKGDDAGVLFIESSRLFHVEYSNLHYPRFHEDPPIDKSFLTSDGKLTSVMGTQTPKRIVPLSKLRDLDARSVRDWVFGFPKYLVAGIHGEAGLSDLVRRASNPSSGYRISVQERRTVVKGRKFHQKHLTVVRNSAIAKKLGPVRIDITIDVDHQLPVAVSTEMAEPGHPPVHVTWHTGWRWTKDAFPSEQFKVYK